MLKQIHVIRRQAALLGILIGWFALDISLVSPEAMAGWQPHEVRHRNGSAEHIQLPAQLQIVTEKWNRVVAVPYIIYMPKKDRLMMLVGCDYPHRAFVLSSDDHGATWTEPRPVRVDSNGKPSVSMGTGLAYLGNGKMMFYANSGSESGLPSRFFSSNHGKTWDKTSAIAKNRRGKPWHIWDRPLVDRNRKTGKVSRLVETGYNGADGHQQAYIRFSTDEGNTWSKSTEVPQWNDANEVALFRAGNGDIIGACRSGVAVQKKKMGETLDHYEGLGVSISKDNGLTWSTVNKLYDYGRHHPSMILMPNNDIVMTYVVRKGYTDDKNGFPQFGIEAIVSHDHGQTWDLDHKYILHAWVGNQKGRTSWWPSSQATSTRLLPDGSILTCFGTGYRIQKGPKNPQAPRDVGLIKWRLNTKPINNDRTIRNAPFDSDLRNIIDPEL